MTLGRHTPQAAATAPNSLCWVRSGRPSQRGGPAVPVTGRAFALADAGYHPAVPGSANTMPLIPPAR
jgi:hypothetical protein